MAIPHKIDRILGRFREKDLPDDPIAALDGGFTTLVLGFADNYYDRVGLHVSFGNFQLDRSVAEDDSLEDREVHLWLDESNHALKVKVKYADGTTIKTGTVCALS
jgi:hypothetical protein